MMDRAALRLILLGVFLISATSDPVKKKQNVDIYSFYINSTVTSRYATTVITSRVANTLNESQGIQFEVKIPKNAFISKFRMVLLKEQEKEDEKKEALKLSLKYQFVTPLTSMVVTKPQEGEVEVADKPKEGEEPSRHQGGYPYQAAIPSFVFLDADDQWPMVQGSVNVLPTMSAPAVHSSRFLLSVVGQSKPLCFDVPVPHKLRLLQDSASGKTDASYEEIQGSQTPTLKINDQEVSASWVDATDYRLSSKPVIKCWLVSFYAAMQKDISDFTVTQL
ncbi:hypothetical protein cypCar_00017916 [Cyprinus carpio]|nr:hypothetical protein cypCar_00017916 [Cyprinus carpio]